MEIQARPSDWGINDQEKWAAFLETETGKRIFPALADVAPQLLAEGDVNKILIRTGELRGFQTVLRELVNLAHPQTKPEVTQQVSEAYPALTDDSKWDDGQKLTPDPKPEPEPEQKLTTAQE